MPELREFIKKEVRSFMREQRIRANLPPTVRLNGYVLGELEEKAEQVPLCELYPIIQYLDDGSFGNWWLNFQMRTAEIKRKRT